MTAVVLLALLLAAAHALGLLFARLRQPRVIGELVGGALLGPTVLGRLAPDLAARLTLDATGPLVLDAASAVGLVTLMFLSGAGMRNLLAAEDRGAVAWLAGVGTVLPFAVTVAVVPFLPLGSVEGDRAGRAPIILVLAIAAAVTSIPVISRILHDLGVLHTRFARLILGVAVVEDVALWGVLAVAKALAESAELPVSRIAWHLSATVAFLILSLAFLRPWLRRLEGHSSNVVVQRWPLAWLAGLVAFYSLTATAYGVSLVFAAFFAGFALAAETEIVKERLRAVERLAYAVAIPVYFAIVGFRLDLGAGFSPAVVVALLAGACAVKLAAVALGARLAGFRGRDLVNLAVATNARGGPGIILATVAFDARIVNAQGYTALVLLAVVTSQIAGVWLERVLRKDGRLLSTDPVERTEPSPR